MACQRLGHGPDQQGTLRRVADKGEPLQRVLSHLIRYEPRSTGVIAQNWFIQGRDKENYSAVIALGAETSLHNSDGLVVRDNEARFVQGIRRESAFVADWTGARVQMADNRLAEGLTKYERR